jgi:hypothetical protein
MSVATERIPVLVTRKEKAEIARMAKAAGLSMGEVLRRGAKAQRATSPEDEKLLLGLIDQMNKSTERASKTIDELLAYVAESNRRIDAMNQRVKQEPAR